MSRAISNYGGQQIGNFTVGTYPGTPAALSANILAEQDERMIGATQQVRDARRQRNTGRKQVRLDYRTKLDELMRGFNDRQQQTGLQLGALGLGYSPAMMGRAQAQLRNEETAAKTDLQASRAEQLDTLNRMLEDARRNQRRTEARIQRERALVSSNPANLIRGVM